MHFRIWALLSCLRGLLQGWAPGQRLPEKLATTLQPLMDLRFISKLLPLGSSLPGKEALLSI